MSTFKQLGVPAGLRKGLGELGITTPTEVQEKVIPVLLQDGGDLVVQAQTGTGKTAAFGLPLLARIDPGEPKIQGLVITPTRELAKQIGKHLFRFTKYTERIFIEVTAGGEPMDGQIERLRRPTQVVVATPGRLLDLVGKKALSLSSVQHLVLDEADEMLSMGFRKELGSILGLTKSRRSTWMFSATFHGSIEQLVKEAMPGRPRVLKIDKAHVVNRNIDHRFVLLGNDEKNEFLIDYLTRRDEERGMIFCQNKAAAIELGKLLAEEELEVAVIQGDLSQRERDKVMRAFKGGRTRILVATDVAARGIDVEALAFVIHHRLPEQLEYYTHRSGRTARAGRKGISLALIHPKERKRVRALEEALGVRFSELER